MPQTAIINGRTHALKMSNAMTQSTSVHSYVAVPTHSDNILATCEYGTSSLVAAIAKSNVVGLQFHPELSGNVGLKILEAFINT